MTFDNIYARLVEAMTRIGMVVTTPSVASSLLQAVALEAERINVRIDNEVKGLLSTQVKQGEHIKELLIVAKNQEERIQELEAVFTQGWQKETEEGIFGG